MTASLKPYPAYKPSGVEWLGEIPEHWELRKLKFIAAQVSEKVEIKSDNINYIGLQNIESWTGKLVESELVTEGTASRFRKNDVLFGKLRPYLAKVYFAEDEGFCSTEALVLRTSSQNPRYLFYFLLSRIFIDLVNSSVYGAKMPRASWDFIGSQLLLFPLPDEQHRIARFLDQKTAEIDKAINKKQRLIDLLKEQKAILINQAVTKGLNPNVPMRDSGVEWIGEVPAHWEVRRAKYVFREVDERSKTGAEELLSVSHMTGITPRSEKSVSMFMAEDYAGSKLCRKGDLVINIMWAWMGALGVSDRVGIVSPSYGIFRQQKKEVFNAWYLEHLLRSIEYVAEYNRRSTGLHSSRLRLYADMFLAMELSIPSKEEQDHIESITTKRTNEIDKTVDAVEREINALDELKSVIISQAVTGKIKV